MSRYRWTILAIGTAAQASYSAVFLGLPVLAPAFQREYDLSLTQVGFVLATVNLGSVATLLPWGLLADRIGERAGLITYTRGRFHILDRVGIEAISCPCYTRITAEYQRMQVDLSRS